MKKFVTRFFALSLVIALLSMGVSNFAFANLSDDFAATNVENSKNSQPDGTKNSIKWGPPKTKAGVKNYVLFYSMKDPNSIKDAVKDFDAAKWKELEGKGSARVCENSWDDGVATAFKGVINDLEGAPYAEANAYNFYIASLGDKTLGLAYAPNNSKAAPVSLTAAPAAPTTSAAPGASPAPDASPAPTGPATPTPVPTPTPKPVKVWTIEELLAIGEIEGVKVLLNNKVLELPQPAIIENGRTLVPLRGIFEGLGAKVAFDAKTKTITATKDAKTVVLTLGKKEATVDGKVVMLDVPASAKKGATMVPLRFVSESFGAKVGTTLDPGEVDLVEGYDEAFIQGLIDDFKADKSIITIATE